MIEIIIILIVIVLIWYYVSAPDLPELPNVDLSDVNSKVNELKNLTEEHGKELDKFVEDTETKMKNFEQRLVTDLTRIKYLTDIINDASRKQMEYTYNQLGEIKQVTRDNKLGMDHISDILQINDLNRPI